MKLSRDQLAVLEAMTQPDPNPPNEQDNVGAAIRRRLPRLSRERAIAVVLELNALGLTEVPWVEGQKNVTATADLTTFITARGWQVLNEARKGQAPGS